MEQEYIIHPETGEVLYRDIRPITYNYKGESVTVNVPGWYPKNSDEGILTKEDCKVGDMALKELKARFLKNKHQELLAGVYQIKSTYTNNNTN